MQPSQAHQSSMVVIYFKKNELKESIQEHHASHCVAASIFNEKNHGLVGINFIHFNTQPINQPLPMELRFLKFLGFSRGTALVSTVKVLYTSEEPMKRLK